jgi:hypothetical protein
MANGADEEVTTLDGGAMIQTYGGVEYEKWGPWRRGALNNRRISYHNYTVLSFFLI